MSKVTLEFDLPEESGDLKLAQNGPHYYLALSDFADLLRKKCKYETEQNTTWEAVKEEFWNVMNEREVSIL